MPGSKHLPVQVRVSECAHTRVWEEAAETEAVPRVCVSARDVRVVCAVDIRNHKLMRDATWSSHKALGL